MYLALLTCLVVQLASAAPPVPKNSAEIHFVAFANNPVVNSSSEGNVSSSGFTEDIANAVQKILELAWKNVDILTKSQQDSLTYKVDTVPLDDEPEDVQVKWRFTDDNETITDNSKNVEVVVTAIMPEQQITENQAHSNDLKVEGIAKVEVPIESVKPHALEAEVLKTATKISEPKKRQINAAPETEVNVEITKKEEHKPETIETVTTESVKQSKSEEPKNEGSINASQTGAAKIEIAASVKSNETRNDSPKTNGTVPSNQTKNEGTLITKAETIQPRLGIKLDVGKAIIGTVASTAGEPIKQLKVLEIENQATNVGAIKESLVTKVEAIQPRLGKMLDIEEAIKGTDVSKTNKPLKQLETENQAENLGTIKESLVTKVETIQPRLGKMLDIEEATKETDVSKTIEPLKQLKVLERENQAKNVGAIKESLVTEVEIIQPRLGKMLDIEETIKESVASKAIEPIKQLKVLETENQAKNVGAIKESLVTKVETIQPRLGKMLDIKEATKETDVSKTIEPIKQLKDLETENQAKNVGAIKESLVTKVETIQPRLGKMLHIEEATKETDISKTIEPLKQLKVLETENQAKNVGAIKESLVTKVETIQPRLGKMLDIEEATKETDVSKTIKPLKQLKVLETESQAKNVGAIKESLVTQVETIQPRLGVKLDTTSENAENAKDLKGLVNTKPETDPKATVKDAAAEKVETAKGTTDDIKSVVPETKESGKLEGGVEVSTKEKDYPAEGKGKRGAYRYYEDDSSGTSNYETRKRSNVGSSKSSEDDDYYY